MASLLQEREEEIDPMPLMLEEKMTKAAAKRRLIVALDCESEPQALNLVATLGDLVSFYKIGWRLFLASGMPLVEELRQLEKEVFLDLKMDDIEETIEHAVRRIAEDEVQFLTIHGNGATARAAKAGRGENACPKLLSVTLLSSLDEHDLKDIFGISRPKSKAPILESYVMYRAEQALQSGCDGLIASGTTIRPLRKAFPEAIIVTPGIRPTGSAHDDHKRATTPTEAIRAGADYLVVGRPIRLAPDPIGAAEAIIQEIETASSTI